MKRDMMAQAITDLDDDLIEQAAEIRPRKSGWVRWSAAAACFLVVSAAAWGMKPGADTPVFFRDTEIGAQAMPISEGISLQTARAVEDSGENVEVELWLDASERTEVRVSAGSLVLPEGKAYPQETDHCTIAVPSTLIWVIEDSDTAQAYRMEVGRRTILLTYEEGAGEWTIREK